MASRGARILITAGPTHEPLDDVRYLANRSSGTLGVALAAAAVTQGADVTLLLGPCGAALPEGCRVVRFETTADLERLLSEHFPACDILIMAAAVADYRPKRAATAKLPRRAERLTLELEPTPDLVAACARLKRGGQLIIGFALEEARELDVRAREKLARKGLDAIVANPLETMGAGSIRATILTAGGERLQPGAGPAPKEQFSAWLVDWALARWNGISGG